MVTLEDNDLVHVAKGDYYITNMSQPYRCHAVERVHQVRASSASCLLKTCGHTAGGAPISHVVLLLIETHTPFPGIS